MADPKEVLWQGVDADGDAVRVAGYDDSYGGVAWSIEWRSADYGNPREDDEWMSVSSGDETDAGECAAVAAIIAGELKEARNG